MDPDTNSEDSMHYSGDDENFIEDCLGLKPENQQN